MFLWYYEYGFARKKFQQRLILFNLEKKMRTPIDGCKIEFSELANNTLPEHFAHLEKNIQNPFSAAWIKEHGVGKKTLLKRLGRTADFPGCYVFIEEKNPIYVGISRGVVARLYQHLTSNDHFSGSLAYYIAKRENDPGGTRKENMKNGDFRTLFEKSQKRLESCSVATVEISNAVELHLFEVYAAMELGTGEWNSFKTH